MIRRQSDFARSNYLLKYKEDSEYVTLASLYLPTKEYNSEYAITTANQEIEGLYQKTKQSLFSQWINLDNSFNRWNFRIYDECKLVLDRKLNTIEEYINSGTVDLGINKDNWESWGDRKGLLKRISGSNTDTVHYRCSRSDDNFYVGNLFLIRNMSDRSRPKIRPIFTMVVKREYIKYVKLCYILGKQPKGEVFEFWITKGFDSKDTTEKYLRSHVYRKHIKPILLEKNIPIIEKDNWLDDIYKIVKQPVVKTLRDRKEWLNSVSSEFTNYLNPQSVGEIWTEEDIGLENFMIPQRDYTNSWVNINMEAFLRNQENISVTPF